MQGLFLGSRPGSGFAGSLQRVFPSLRVSLGISWALGLLLVVARSHRDLWDGGGGCDGGSDNFESTVPN